MALVTGNDFQEKMAEMMTFYVNEDLVTVRVFRCTDAAGNWLAF